MIIAAASCILFEIMVRASKRLIRPTDVEIFQELEKDPDLRARFEAESRSELAAGRSSVMEKQSSPDSELDEKAAQAQKEGEVVEMLQRPRTLEAGDGPRKSGVETGERLTAVEGDENNASRSPDIHEMLARRFGNVKR